VAVVFWAFNAQTAPNYWRSLDQNKRFCGKGSKGLKPLIPRRFFPFFLPFVFGSIQTSPP
jgi:hypothetical protein